MSEELQLNVHVTEVEFKRNRKEKLNRRDRMKRKRLERRQLESAEIENTSVEEFGISESSPKSKKRKKEEDVGGYGDQGSSSTKPRGFVSSLFGKNPEIPSISCGEVNTLTEKVFSNKDFSTYNLHPHMVANLGKKLQITQMTSVQRETIPHILQGRDVLVKSQTGSGKTLSYAVPIIEKLVGQEPKIQRYDGPYAIIIVPTRELAVQSYDTFVKLVYPFTWIVPGTLMGGENKAKEKARIRKGINVLVATPGRLLDHINSTKSLTVNRVQWLVIDEADRLLDMGFEKNVSQIITELKERGPSQRQTVLLSATLSAGVERLAGMSLQSPVRINISGDSSSQTTLKEGSDAEVPEDVQDEKFAMPQTLKHHFVVVPSKLRLVTLAAFIYWKCQFSSKKSKMIVFLATQDSVEFHFRLFSSLLSDGEDADEEKAELNFFRLHGDMTQKDVAARGLDLPHVRWIVQYNTPGAPTDYIHRVGRTARIGGAGRAIIFLSPAETAYVKVLNNAKIKLEELKMDDILQTLLLQSKELLELPKGELAHTVQESATALQMRFENYIQEHKDTRSMARKAYQSFIRAYATYPSSLKYIFHVKNLHLGHVAKSFGLQEAPAQIGGIVGKFAKMDSRNKAGKHSRGCHDRQGDENAIMKKSKPTNMKAHMKNLLVSEFSPGSIDAKPIKQKVKTKKKTASQ